MIDVGCGTGRTLRDLAPTEAMALGLDWHLPAPHERDIVRVRADVEALPLDDGVFDLVLALDVLEHVDDRRAAHELRRLLRPGGTVIVTVPAFQGLWSFRDEDAGHRRRYRRPELVELLESAGLVCVHASYFVFALFPLIVATRLLGRRRRGMRDMEDRVPPRSINYLFTRLLTSEAAWVSRGRRLPVGSSIVAVAVAA